MGRGQCTFRQRDVTAALKAVAAAGMAVSTVVFDKEGKFRITVVSQAENGTSGRIKNEWDSI